jgi:TolA-binding protein
MRRQHHDDQEEAGWISLVDLLTVLVLIGGVAAVGYSRSLFSEAQAARKAQADAEAKVGKLNQLYERALRKAGDWQVVAETAEGKVREKEGEIENLNEAIEQLKGVVGVGVEQVMKDRDKAVSERDQAATERDEAKAEQTSLQGKLEAAQASNSKAEQFVQDLQEALVRAGVQVPRRPDGSTVPTDEDIGPSTREQEWAKQVLGLSGRLDRTVFVVDRSQSMALGGRWDEAKKTVHAYIKNLPVSQAALVVFGSDVKAFPSDLHQGRGQQWGTEELPAVTRESRSALLRELDQLSPAGETRTKRALQRAMEFKDVDTIFLFTDGTPDTAEGGGDPRESVLRLVTEWKQAHPHARIHTVGIGDYFNRSMRDFLLGIATRTEGTFIGK